MKNRIFIYILTIVLVNCNTTKNHYYKDVDGATGIVGYNYQINHSFYDYKLRLYFEKRKFVDTDTTVYLLSVIYIGSYANNFAFIKKANMKVEGNIIYLKDVDNEKFERNFTLLHYTRKKVKVMGPKFYHFTPTESFSIELSLDIFKKIGKAKSVILKFSGVENNIVYKFDKKDIEEFEKFLKLYNIK